MYIHSQLTCFSTYLSHYMSRPIPTPCGVTTKNNMFPPAYSDSPCHFSAFTQQHWSWLTTLQSSSLFSFLMGHILTTVGAPIETAPRVDTKSQILTRNGTRVCCSPLPCEAVQIVETPPQHSGPCLSLQSTMISTSAIAYRGTSVVIVGFSPHGR
jgi:hypothetical protein